MFEYFHCVHRNQRKFQLPQFHPFVSWYQTDRVYREFFFVLSPLLWISSRAKIDHLNYNIMSQFTKLPLLCLVRKFSKRFTRKVSEIPRKENEYFSVKNPSYTIGTRNPNKFKTVIKLPWKYNSISFTDDSKYGYSCKSGCIVIGFGSH